MAEGTPPSKFRGWDTPSHAVAPSVAQANAEDSALALSAVVDLLVAAGYFRARLAGLAPFDRIVGGLAWCIANASPDVELEVSFAEDATIGDKVRMGEAIERALARLGCRVPLQAHQLQGLDLRAILPVAQWLVKEAIVSRQHREAAMRQVAHSYHARAARLMPTGDTLGERIPEGFDEAAAAEASRAAAALAPPRRYRRTRTGRPRPDVLARLVLMEYGWAQRTGKPVCDALAHPPGGPRPTVSTAGPPHEPRDGAGAVAAGADVVAAGAPEAAAGGGGCSPAVTEPGWALEAREVLREVHAPPYTEAAVGAGSVGDLVGVRAAEIREASGAFAKAAEEAERARRESPSEVARAEAARARGRAAALRGEAQALILRAGAVEEDGSVLLEGVARARAAAEAANGAAKDARAAVVATDARALAAAPQVARQLRERVASVSSLRRAERTFKERCRARLAALEEEAARTEAPAAAGHEGAPAEAAADVSGPSRLTQLEQLHAQEVARLEHMSALHGAKSRSVAVLRRAVEDTPTRGELVQFERRFRDLHDEVSAKHAEAKGFFALFNSLQDQRLLLEKEVALLASVTDKCPRQGATREVRVQFGASMESLLASVQQSVSKSHARVDTESARRIQLETQYAALLESQRRYQKLVHEYRQECERHEHMGTSGARP